KDLGGGTPGGFGPPAGPNLTAIVPKWTDADFLKTIRTGTDPAGHKLDPEQMPYTEISAATTDDDLKAIYLYLKSLPPVNRVVPTMTH
ncbi:MAG: cytochrome c, partial [Chloroflexi bacterium]|nr:cytochrome c [Chloroflexota bacterium]